MGTVDFIRDSESCIFSISPDLNQTVLDKTINNIIKILFTSESLPSLQGLALFQSLAFLYLEITFPFAKLCYAFEEKRLRSF